tara:strand:+ start:1190 stop:1738 length:549 start_codon:yes stop_codon:yes gene_type:complete
MSNEKIIKYLQNYQLIFESDYEPKIIKLVDLIKAIKESNKRIYIMGNGASAAISSHIANDLTKATKTRASTFHDPSLITCFGNDFGYDNWMKEALNHFSENGDLIILISSSGTSKNIVEASNFCKKNKLNLVSLTGPNPDQDVVDNSMINFSVDSKIYNVIECIHMIILTSAIDQIYQVNLD